MEKELEEYLKHLEEVKTYANRVSNLPIIETMNPDYVYLMHHTSLPEEDIQDIYLNGITYEDNDVRKTFNNLSNDWFGKNRFSAKAYLTSMEEVIVEQCKQGNYQCFLYKIPVVFFKKINEEFYPLPIWNLDKNYVYKKNPSSSGIKYQHHDHKKVYFRLHPQLLLGHYDLKTNTFYRNQNYSPIIDNPTGIYDRYQLMQLSSQEEYQDFWQHNEFILKEDSSPFQRNISEIGTSFSARERKDTIVWK